MSITLPPLPKVDYDAGWHRQYTADQLRARDLEVARLVLEGAAKHIQKQADDYDEAHGHTDPDTGTREYPGEGEAYVFEMTELADAIRTLEVRHV